MLLAAGVDCSYTLEASLGGKNGFHFSVNDLLQLGQDLCASFLELYPFCTSTPKPITLTDPVLSSNLSRSSSALVGETTINATTAAAADSPEMDTITSLRNELLLWKKYFNPDESGFGVSMLSPAGIKELSANMSDGVGGDDNSDASSAEGEGERKSVTLLNNVNNSGNISAPTTARGNKSDNAVGSQMSTIDEGIENVSSKNKRKIKQKRKSYPIISEEEEENYNGLGLSIKATPVTRSSKTANKSTTNAIERPPSARIKNIPLDVPAEQAGDMSPFANSSKVAAAQNSLRDNYYKYISAGGVDLSAPGMCYFYSTSYLYDNLDVVALANSQSLLKANSNSRPKSGSGNRQSSNNANNTTNNIINGGKPLANIFFDNHQPSIQQLQQQKQPSNVVKDTQRGSAGIAGVSTSSKSNDSQKEKKNSNSITSNNKLSNEKKGKVAVELPSENLVYLGM